MGYVWCDGYVWDMCGVRYVWDMCGVRYVWDMCGVRYVWDMCGVRYANNLLKNPATKRLSGKTIAKASQTSGCSDFLNNLKAFVPKGSACPPS